MRSRSLRRTILAAAVSVALLGATGCAQIVDTFNAAQGQNPDYVVPTPEESTTVTVFESQFTDDGSVSLSSDVADQLEVRLDVWAKDPKQTLQWHPQGAKSFGFAINVYDHRVDEKAVLAQKRRVYISHVAITSQTSQSSLQSSAPFQFSADPRTLVPADTLRSDRGLLLNSYQGGLLVPELTIHQLPDDTFGVTLQFAITVDVESTANDDLSFQGQMIYQTLPIAIFPASAED